MKINLDEGITHQKNIFIFLSKLGYKDLESIKQIDEDGNTTIIYNKKHNKIIQDNIDKEWNKIFDYPLYHDYEE